MKKVNNQNFIIDNQNDEEFATVTVDERQQYQGMGESQRKNNSGVKWPDECDENEPISKTIPESQMK